MNEYPKIQTVYKRDPKNPKRLLRGQFSIPELKYLAQNEWEFTEKVDGTNIRIIVPAYLDDPIPLAHVPIPVTEKGCRIVIAGKTDNAQIPSFLANALVSQFFPLSDKLSAMSHKANETIILYGEGYGPKIQNGGKYRKDQGFVLFDIKIGRWWLKREDVHKISYDLNIDRVPVIGYGDLYDMVHMTEEGFSSQWGSFPAEGIVARPTIEMFSRNGDRIITKIKYRDFQE